MNQKELEELIQTLTSLPKETETVEFKENNSSKERIGEDISALSNSVVLAPEKGFAYLVFGVQDITHEIVGTLYKPKQKKVGSTELEFWLHQRISPKIDFLIYEFVYKEKHIALFKIPPPITKPVAFSGVPYIRIGSSTTELKNHEEKERKIWLNLNKTSFEQNVAKESLTASEVLEFLDYSAYLTLTNQKPPSQTVRIVEAMTQHGLVKEALEEEKYNILNLGAILFAKDLADFHSVMRKKVRIITYKINTKATRDREYEESLGYAAAFKKVLDYIHQKLPINEKISKSFREEQKMYPDVAIREFVANALIHQDLSIGGAGPIVEIFDDSIEITNPGKPLIDTNRFIDHPARSRNESMARFMRNIGICEESGKGIDRALIDIEFYQLPAPKFEAFPEFTRVTLYSHRNLKDMSKEERIRACYQHCVLLHVQGERMTNTSLRERLNIKGSHHPVATTIINEAIDQKLIKKHEKRGKYIPFWA